MVNSRRRLSEAGEREKSFIFSTDRRHLHSGQLLVRAPDAGH